MHPIQRKLTLLSAFTLAVAAVCVSAQEKVLSPPSAVLASQGGESLTLADMDAFANRIPVDKRAGFFNSPVRINGVISNLLLQKQLAAEARTSGMAHSLKGDDNAAPETDEDVAKTWLQSFRANVKVPDLSELAAEEYSAHKENYVTRGKLTVKDVLISAQVRGKTEAMTIADAVETDAKANPDQFDKLVEKYSDDPDKAVTNGVLEQLGEKGKYPQELTKAAKALDKVGDISPVISTPGGFHVMKLVERVPDEQRSFAAAKADIIARLSNEFVENAVKDHVDQLRNRLMTADPDLVASLRTRYGNLQAIPENEHAPVAGK